jgi:hypothetical protein
MRRRFHYWSYGTNECFEGGCKISKARVFEWHIWQVATQSNFLVSSTNYPILAPKFNCVYNYYKWTFKLLQLDIEVHKLFFVIITSLNFQLVEFEDLPFLSHYIQKWKMSLWDNFFSWIQVQGWCTPKFLKGPKCGSKSKTTKKEENWGTLFNLQHFRGRKAC